MDVRPVQLEDAVAVAGLLEELGYPVSAARMTERLEERAPSQDDAAWVLAHGPGGPDGDDTIVGFAAGHVFQPYELDRPVAEITALVVAPANRRAGSATALVSAVEQWASARSCLRITVASSLRREGAHAFYARLGYRQLAKKFEKALDRRSPDRPLRTST